MNIQLNKTLLSIFFGAFALIALSACGSSSSGTAATPPAPACNPDTHFCDTSGVAKAGCDSATYFCATTGVAKASCDSATYFCGSTGALKSACLDATHDCTTGLANPVCSNPANPPVNEVACYGTRAAYNAPDKAAMATNLNRDFYMEISAGATIAQAVTAIQAEPEYQANKGLDQINAAYAYARGYAGSNLLPVIISSMSTAPASRQGEISSQLLRSNTDSTKVRGYTAHSTDSTDNAGVCPELINCPDSSDLGTHLAGIMVAGAGDDGIHGIAYQARLKPIDIYTTAGALVDNAKLIAAIGEASGMESYRDVGGAVAKTASITVMNNGWNISANGEYDADSNPTTTMDNYHYETVSEPNLTNIPQLERDAWEDAVEDADTGNTVVVFGAGDQGHNSENGMVQLYTDEARTMKATNADSTNKKIAWSSIAGGGGNQASAHARLASVEKSTLGGKWLTVIALEDIDDSANEELRIASFSNGCGDTKNYCLGAPGVNINSVTFTSDLQEYDGTAQAAAHVTGAIAVLKGAFNHLEPDELVEVILVTADDLGIAGVDEIYGYGALNLARAVEPIGPRTICLPSYTMTTGQTMMDDTGCENKALATGITVDNSGITLPTSFGNSLNGFTVGFIDDYKRAYIGKPTRITRQNASFTLADTIATWDSPELQSITLDSNSKMQFTNYDENEDAKDTLIFTHNLPNHTIAFSYNEQSKTPDLRLTDETQELHFQKIRPIASDLMQVNSTHKLGKAWNVKNAITSGEFDTGKRFNEAMANLNYASENRNLTIGAGTLQEYGQFLGASGTGAYQLSDATQSQVTHLALTQNLPLNSAIKLKYTGFKTEVDMRYNNFANINDLTADEYQISLTKNKILGKNDSLNIELIQPFAITDGTLQQNTVLGYTAAGDYNNVTQNYSLKPTNRRQQLRMTWQNQINPERKTRLFISMQYENHTNNLRDNNDSQILGGVSTRF